MVNLKGLNLRLNILLTVIFPTDKRPLVLIECGNILPILQVYSSCVKSLFKKK